MWTGLFLLGTSISSVNVQDFRLDVIVTWSPLGSVLALERVGRQGLHLLERARRGDLLARGPRVEMPRIVFAKDRGHDQPVQTNLSVARGPFAEGVRAGRLWFRHQHGDALAVAADHAVQVTAADPLLALLDQVRRRRLAHRAGAGRAAGGDLAITAGGLRPPICLGDALAARLAKVRRVTGKTGLPL